MAKVLIMEWVILDRKYFWILMISVGGWMGSSSVTKRRKNGYDGVVTSGRKEWSWHEASVFMG